MSNVILVIFLLFPETWFEPEVLCGNSLATLGTPLALFHNPALIPQRTSFFQSYSQPFGVSDLKEGKTVFARKGAALGLSFLKGPGYLEGSFLIGARKNYEKGRFGFTVRCLYLQIDDVPAQKNFSLDGGFFYPFGRLGIGAFLRNLNSPTLMGSPLLPSINLALNLSIEEQVTFFIDLFLDPGYPLSVRVGENWKLHRLLLVSAGASSYPPIISLGFTLGEKPRVSFSLKGHPELGSTRSVSLTW